MTRDEFSQTGSELPRVSVVLTTYRRAAHLEHSIEAILNQTLDDFELIVTDDASPDRTAEVVGRFQARDRRVRYLRQPTNLGMPGNLNAGIARARGELIANLHDGDHFLPTLLEEWVRALDECPEAGFVFNAIGELDERGNIRRVFREDLPACFSGAALLETVFYRRWRFGSPVWGTSMVRRTAYAEMGEFRQRFEFCADVDMWLRLSERYAVAYVDKPLILLPAPEILPSNFMDKQVQRARLAEQMFLESRLRHFRSRPVRRAAEVARHFVYVGSSRTYDTVLRLRRNARDRARRFRRRALGGGGIGDL